MAETVCIFNSNKSECAGRIHSHLQYLICGKHLAEIYGNKLANSYIENPTEVVLVGFNFTPVDGVYFRKNDVILPVRERYDKTYRPSAVVSSESDRIYRINSKIDEFMRRVVGTGKISPSDRITYELIRNMSEPIDKMNVNPTEQCENNPQSIAYIRSKYTISETYIQKYCNMQRINNITLLEEDGHETKLSVFPELSLSYKYFLSRMEYSSHVVYGSPAETSAETQRMKPNARFIKGTGLVAMSDISDPDPIVVFGVSRNMTDGNQDSWYEEICVRYPKEIINTRPMAGRIGTLGAARRAFTSSCI